MEHTRDLDGEARAIALDRIENERPPEEPALCAGTEDFLRQMEQTQFERYWVAIQPFTFASAMVPMTAAELDALHLGYEQIRAGSASVAAVLSWPEMVSVAAKVELGMGEIGVGVGSPVFVRVSSRSPKDAILSAPSIDFKVEVQSRAAEVAIHEAELYEKHPYLPASSPLNQQLHAQYIASTRLLATSTGAQAVENLLHSARIQEDLLVAAEKLRAIPRVPPLTCRNTDTFIPTSPERMVATVATAEYRRVERQNVVVHDGGTSESRIQSSSGEPARTPPGRGGSDADNFSFNLVVREFGKFQVRNEVRGFVYQWKFTALTQYNDMVFFPHAVVHQTEVRDQCTAFMSELVPRLQQDPTANAMDSFVVDLVILDDGRVRIIEINPFAEYAGSGLFSWEKPDDLAVLKGRAPFEYRLVERLPCPEKVLGDMTPEYRSFLELP
eukprot:gene4737-5793_t